MSGLLDPLGGPEDLRKIPVEKLPGLAAEIRRLIIDVVTRNGGHLGSNLGVVELAIALHYTHDFLKDRLVWDVSHQAYPHKILTGRRERFDTIRMEGGLSGFTSPEESPYDLFHTAHAGTAISTCLGMVSAADLRKERRRVVAVVGDAGLALGMSFEALNHAGDLEKNLTVVLNDNRMSISKSVGAFSRYLNRIRTGHWYNEIRKEMHKLIQKIPLVGRQMDAKMEQVREAVLGSLLPGHLFEDLGFRYFGPIDGHDVAGLIGTFERTRELEGPLLLHVVTEKGHGLDPAEGDPALRHAASPRISSDGKLIRKEGKRPAWTQAFAESLIGVAESDDRVVAITAAMPEGTGLDRFAERFPERTFDVGICEQHGVGLAGGLAKGGLRPVAAIYSSFLQRAYDQVFHEVCLQGLPVLFCMDRAGVVGADGATHNGVFDIAYLRTFPRMTLMAPKDAAELDGMIRFALDQEGPCGIRYPRGTVPEPFGKSPPIESGRSETLREGEDGALFAYGAMVPTALAVADRLASADVHLTVVNARFAKPVDADAVVRLTETQPFVMTIEDHQLAGGFGSAVLETASAAGADARKLILRGIPDRFVGHGDRGRLLGSVGLDVDGILAAVCDRIGIPVPTPETVGLPA